MRKRTILVLLVSIAALISVLFLNWLSVRNSVVGALKKQLREDFLGKAVLEDKKAPVHNSELKLSFAVVTDIHNNTKGLNSAIEEINKSKVQFVIGLGDYTNVGTKEEFNPIKNSLSRLAKPVYLLPGDHDLWNGRDKDKSPDYYFDEAFPGDLNDFTKSGVQFLFLDNADLYEGVHAQAIETFENELDQTNEPVIIITSHKAIYHPLTIHRMGYINDTKNEKVAAQATELLGMINAKKNSKIILLSGDLHAFSKYNLPSDKYEAYTIGALTDTKNFQSPRYAIVNVYKDNTVVVSDIPLTQ
ncbi:MAG: metallophosphoesterase [bacterium]|nr:metallophosphoesterase [bacterium]